MSDVKKKILKDLEKSGFPTEIKATKILENQREVKSDPSSLLLTVRSVFSPSWSIINQKSYFDKKNNVVQSVDIFAQRHIYGSETPLKIEKHCNLYIECKKSNKAKWVFYTKNVAWPAVDMFLRRSPEQRQLFQREYNPFNFIPKKYDTIKPNIGISFQTALGKRDDFYKAQTQVLKAIFYSENIAYSDKFMFIPVILYEGGIYKYDITKDVPNLESIDFIRYISQGIPESPIPIHIDVVNIDYFSEYLDIIEKELEQY